MPRSRALLGRSLPLPAAAALLLALASGCTRPAAPPSPPTPAPAPAPVDEELPPPESEPPPPAPGACAEGGRLWDGKPQGCSYEHAGCCYDSPTTACAAAGCSEERCQILESYPAQIRCAAPEAGGS